MITLAKLSQALDLGETTSAALVEKCLERITDPAGEGSRTFIAFNQQSAREQASHADALRGAGKAPGPLCGIPISIKALFDIEGRVTTAGSVVLRGGPPASADAEAVRRLRAAGLVILGHTNMTEFAYSGLGLNPHYGTPRNPHDRRQGRIPGGSSSGGAVSVTDGMAAAALGTDTGGSCRIPAAFCGITGFKPTARRVPLAGAFPLSQTLDSIGPLAPSVDCCARLDAILANGNVSAHATTDISSLRLAVLENYVIEGLTPQVSAAFERATRILEKAGAHMKSIKLPDLDRLPQLNGRGGIVAAEAFRVHETRLSSRGSEYDPRVSVRICKAREQAPGEYGELLRIRAEFIERAAAATAPFDAVLLPTTPMQAPLLRDLEDDAEYGRLNLLALRNPTVANFLDRCAISMPLPLQDGLPVGLTLMGETMGDRALLGIAASIEAALARD